MTQTRKTLPARKPASPKSAAVKTSRAILALPDEATFKELARSLKLLEDAVGPKLT